MTAKANSAQLKRQNKTLIYRFLLAHPESTKPEISVHTGLSIPTAGQIVTELCAGGVAIAKGERESSGGRRAMAYSINVNSRKALGVSVTRNHAEFVLLNLAREIVAAQQIDFPFIDSQQYFDDLEDRARKFLKHSRVSPKNLLGTGIALPGVMGEGACLLYSHVLKTAHPIRLDSFLSGDVVFFNDATAACMAEMYDHSAPENFTFLSLSDTVGGANVIANRIVHGDDNRGGEIGHICLIPGGRPCYCGKLGHYDAYGSALLLKSKSDDNTIEGFLRKLRYGDETLQRFFDEYLEHLALFISNLHTMTDLPVMIGGYVGNNLADYLTILRQKARNYDIFPQDEPYVLLAKHGFTATAEGAAGHYVEAFAAEL